MAKNLPCIWDGLKSGPKCCPTHEAGVELLGALLSSQYYLCIFAEENAHNADGQRAEEQHHKNTLLIQKAEGR